MAWSNSKVFQRHLTNMIGNTLAFDYDADTIKVALYGTSITPDNDVTTDVLTAYNGAASQWVTGGEIIDSSGGGTDWPAGGLTLGTKSLDVSVADFVSVRAANAASGATADIAAAFGCLVYDDTLATKVGMSYNYFGGTQSVTAGTFTIVWHANGIVRYTL